MTIRQKISAFGKDEIEIVLEGEQVFLDIKTKDVSMRREINKDALIDFATKI